MEIKKSVDIHTLYLYQSSSSSSEPATADITLVTADTTTATIITSMTIPANITIPESIAFTSLNKYYQQNREMSKSSRYLVI